ncbi:MAG: hypothetical protein VKO21_07505 [Candidatus Sericytochromatia bacterium]|nr:hypothetical protein [Candidatus Sericytochromatia bacterium]
MFISNVSSSSSTQKLRTDFGLAKEAEQNLAKDLVDGLKPNVDIDSFTNPAKGPASKLQLDANGRSGSISRRG